MDEIKEIGYQLAEKIIEANRDRQDFKFNIIEYDDSIEIKISYTLNPIRFIKYE